MTCNPASFDKHDKTTRETCPVLGFSYDYRSSAEVIYPRLGDTLRIEKVGTTTLTSDLCLKKEL